jgi:low affinity Fe/Cu permease
MRPTFNTFAKATARFSGRPTSFALAILIVVVWLFSGPAFGFSDTWQLVINTGTTVVTFLMVFLIQNTQVRDTEAMQIKLDELIRATEAASNALLDLEELDEGTLDRYRETYELLARKSRKDKAAQGAA